MDYIEAAYASVNCFTILFSLNSALLTRFFSVVKWVESKVC